MDSNDKPKYRSEPSRHGIHAIPTTDPLIWFSIEEPKIVGYYPTWSRYSDNVNEDTATTVTMDR